MMIEEMEKHQYHETLKTMQDAGVDRDYAVGWASGALGNPPREEQRVTAAYESGYADGVEGVTDRFRKWIGQHE